MEFATQHDLVQHLLLKAGRIMEDVSPEFALPMPENPVEVGKQIDQLTLSANGLCALAAAARMLLEAVPDRS
ncbi:hypothetical protein GRI72_11470 [Altererythrobacter marinus]|uniref:Uncharacterized protein n=1 Tax=Pelagerythrobacter marinus TaxID=538382 RepID=A0ABW9V3D8_9SPHN|nr:hypothetical protein [Pelagerythrobacter marinus]MXO69442.1 hypothetical protein [Pelagerythrobacter marinus]